MCFGSKPPSPPAQMIAAPPPMPTRADEENRAGVSSQLNALRAMKGYGSTVLTGGLGDSSYGQNVTSITRQTKLGGRE